MIRHNSMLLGAQFTCFLEADLGTIELISRHCGAFQPCGHEKRVDKVEPERIRHNGANCQQNWGLSGSGIVGVRAGTDLVTLPQLMMSFAFVPLSDLSFSSGISFVARSWC